MGKTGKSVVEQWELVCHKSRQRSIWGEEGKREIRDGDGSEQKYK